MLHPISMRHVHGELYISTISAVLMGIFFVVFGVTMGIYTGSLLLKRKRGIDIWVPALVATGITAIMYIGELILLSGFIMVRIMIYLTKYKEKEIQLVRMDLSNLAV